MGFDLNEFFQSQVKGARGGYQQAQDDLKQDVDNYDVGGPMDANPGENFTISQGDISASALQQRTSFRTTGRGSGFETPEMIIPGDPNVQGAVDQNRFLKQSMTRTEDIARSEVSRLQRSIIAGSGQVVSMVGDIFNFLHAITPDTGETFEPFETVGTFLTKHGDKTMNEYKNTYIPKELETITPGDMFNPTFWTGDVAQQVPNFLAMLTPGVAGTKLASKGLLKYLPKYTKASRGFLDDTVGVVTRTKGGFGKYTPIINVGIEGADDFILSRSGKALSAFLGGGIGTTMVDGATIAGQTYRQGLQVGLTEEESSVAAANVFGNNFAWAGINAISWGLTFGGVRLAPVRGLVNKMPKNTFGKTVSGILQSRITSGISKAGLEAVEESFQETYQDWVQKRQLAKAQGIPFKYDGDYLYLSSGYAEYYNSPENNRTKYVAGATGILGGGFSSILNDTAKQQLAMDRQREILEQNLDLLNDNSRTSRLAVVDNVVKHSVESRETQELEAYLQEQLDKGIIDQKLFDFYTNVLNSYEELYNRIPEYIEETEGFGKEQYFSNLALIERNKNALKYGEQELQSWKDANKDAEGTKAYNEVLAQKEGELAELANELEQASAKAREINLGIEQEILTENRKFKKGVSVTPEGKLTRGKGKKVGGQFAPKSKLDQEQKEDILTKEAEKKQAEEKSQESEKTEEQTEGEPSVVKRVVDKAGDIARKTGERLGIVSAKEETPETTPTEETTPEVSAEEKTETKPQATEDISVSKVASKIETGSLSPENVRPQDKSDVDAAVKSVAEKLDSGVTADKLTKNEKTIAIEFAEEVRQSRKKKVETKTKGKTKTQTSQKSKPKPRDKKGKKSNYKSANQAVTKNLNFRLRNARIANTMFIQDKLGVAVGIIDSSYNHFGTTPAYEVAGAIFVDPNKLYQELFVHEYTGHIYFRANQDSPLIKKFIQEYANSNEYAAMKGRYPELEMFSYNGQELTLSEISQDLHERSFNKKDNFYYAELEADLQALIDIVDEIAANETAGAYEGTGVTKQIEDYAELKRMLQENKLVKELKPGQQMALMEEGWATYISDPDNPNTREDARKIFDGLMENPQENKKRKSRIKRFWNLVSKQAKSIEKEATATLQSKEGLAGLSLDEIKGKLTSDMLRMTPEEVRQGRATSSRRMNYKPNRSLTDTSVFENELATNVYNELVNNPKLIKEFAERYKDNPSDLLQDEEFINVIVESMTQLSYQYGVHNRFAEAIIYNTKKLSKLNREVIDLQKKIDSATNVDSRREFVKQIKFKRAQLVKAAAKIQPKDIDTTTIQMGDNSMSVRNFAQAIAFKVMNRRGINSAFNKFNTQVSKLSKDATLSQIEKTFNNALSKEGLSDLQIEGLASEQLRVVIDEYEKVFGINYHGLDAITDINELVDYSDNILNIYNKDKDELLSGLSSLMMDFTRVYMQTEQAQSKKKTIKQPYVKQKALGAMAIILQTAQQHRGDLQGFIASIRSNKNSSVRAFLKYLEDRLEVEGVKYKKPLQLLRTKEKSGVMKSLADHLLTSVWINFSNKTNEQIFNTVQRGNDSTQTNNLDLFNEETTASEERALVARVIKEGGFIFNEGRDGARRRRDVAFTQKMIDAIRGLNEDKSTTFEDAESILMEMFDVYGGNYFFWNTLEQTGIVDGKNRISLNDWFKKNENKIIKASKDPKIAVDVFAPVLQQAALNSRVFYYFTMIKNAEGNPSNTMNSRSFIINQNERLNEFFTRKDNETDQEYNDRVFDRAKELRKIYGDNVYLPFELKTIDGVFTVQPKQNVLKFRGGLISQLNNKGLNYVRLTPQELMVSEMTDFISALGRRRQTDSDGNIVDTTYMQQVGVFAEKTRMYYVETKLLKDTQIKEEIDLRLSEYVGQRYGDTLGKPKELILPFLKSKGKKAVIDEVYVNKQVRLLGNHINNNLHLYKDNVDFQNLFDGNKLNAQGKKALRTYILNYGINRFQAQRMFIGDHKQFKNETDYVKRSAGAIARQMPADINQKVDLLILKDQELDGDSEMDAQGYMLQEDADIVGNQYGLNFMRNDFETARHFKYVYYGQDLREDALDNNVFGPHSAMYAKANVMSITKDMENKNPYLASVAELLRARKKDLTNRKENYQVVAYQESAIKTAPFKLEDYTINLDNTTSSGVNALYQMQIKEQYDNLYSNDEGYVGLDGQNFGVQLILDKEKFTSPMAAQSYSQHLTNTTPETELLAQGAHRAIARAMQYQLEESGVKKYYNVDEYTESKQISLNKSLLDKISSNWAGNPTANLSEYASPFFPKLNVSRNSILNKLIVEVGTKVTTPGTIAFQVTPYGYNLKSFTTLGALKESAADQNERNTIDKLINKYDSNLTVSEVILPYNMQKDYNVGDIILGSRIPSHAKSTQPVLIVKDFFDRDAGSIIAVGTKVSKAMGSDLDGDAIFVNGRYVKKNLKLSETAYNRAFDNIVSLNGHPAHQAEASESIEFEDTAKDALKFAEETLGRKQDSFAEESSQMMPIGMLNAFNENVPAGGMIGIAATMQRDLNYFAHHNAELDFSVRINGVERNKITDDGGLTYLQTAKVLNIILDNPKYQYARKLGFTYETIKTAMLLLRMGYGFNEVATILNSQGALKYGKYASERTVINVNDMSYYTPGQKAMVEYYESENNNKEINSSIEFLSRKQSPSLYVRQNIDPQLKVDKGGVINLDFSDVQSNEFNMQVVKLLDNLNKVGTEVFNAGRIIGAYGLTMQNGFQVDKLISDFNNVGSKDSRFIEGPINKLKADPIIQHNIKVLNKIKELDQEINTQYSTEAVAVQKEINKIVSSDQQNIFESHPIAVRQYQLFRMQQDLSVLQDMPSIDALFAEIEQVKLENDKLPYELQNRFIADGIILNPETKSVSLNSRFVDSNIPESDLFVLQRHFDLLDQNRGIGAFDVAPGTPRLEIDRVEDENGYIPKYTDFSPDLRKTFIQMDFLQNGWIGSSSTSVLWSPNAHGVDFKINQELNNLILDNKRTVTNQEAKSIALNFLKDYSFNAPSVTMRESDISEDGTVYVIAGFPPPVVDKLQKENTQHVVKSWDNTDKKYRTFEYVDGKYYLIGESKFNPKTQEQHNRNNKTKTFKQVSRKAADRTFFSKRSNKGRYKGSNDVSDTITNRAEQSGIPTKALSKDAYFQIKGLSTRNRTISAGTEQYYNKMYENYVEQHQDLYDTLYLTNIKTNKYKEMPEGELVGISVDLAKFDKVLYNQYIEYIGVELTERMEKEQIANIAKVANKNNISLVGKDLGAWESWLISNNLKQTNPEVQNIIRKLQNDYMKFVKDYRREANIISKLEKQIKDNRLSNLTNTQMVGLFLRGKLNDYIYKNLYKTKVNADGREFIVLRPEEEIKGLPQYEIEFYLKFKDMVQKYSPGIDESSIPFKSMSGVPSLARHGLLGLYKSQIGSTSDLNNIKVLGELPDGTTEIRTFAEFKTLYEAKTKDSFLNKAKNVVRLEKARKRAVAASKRGMHDDKTPILLNKAERATMTDSDIFYNMIDNKNVSVSELGSKDLGDILKSYVHSNMFKHGSQRFRQDYLNEVNVITDKDGKKYFEETYQQWAVRNEKDDFIGMQSYLPLIDGAIALNKLKGNDNMVDYLQEVWKDNIIGGKKQKTFNSVFDWTVNKLVDLTTLSYIGLDSSVALGNTAMGKYTNLRAKGGKEFVRGEKRFWQGFLGGQESVKDKLTRAKKLKFGSTNKTSAMLNELFKFEYYQYEDISAVHKQNPLFRLALWPMEQSEKWIQGVMFFGQMSQKQWNSYDADVDGNLLVKAVDGKFYKYSDLELSDISQDALSIDRINQIIFDVKKQQGFGYSPLDQRRLSMYSWIRALGQFKKYFFTFGRERVGEENIDMYGNADIGTYRAAFEYTKDMYEGKKDFNDFKKLPKYKKDAIIRYVRGVAYTFAAMLAYGLSSEDDDSIISNQINRTAHARIQEQNIFFNPERLKFMATPPVVNFVSDRLGY